MPTFEDAIEDVLKWDRQNREAIGDWQDLGTAMVAAYWERGEQERDELLTNWLDASFVVKAAWTALDALACDFLRSDLQLPTRLALWLAYKTEGKIKKPKTGAYSTYMRDYGLARMVVALSQRYVMTPTRNDATTDRASACDVVAAALNLDYKTVAAAYRKHKDSVF